MAILLWGERMSPEPGSHISRACLSQGTLKLFAGRRGSQNSSCHFLFLPPSSVGFPPDPRASCIPNGHSHTFLLLQIPLVQNLLYSPWSGQWKQTYPSAQTETESQDYPGREADPARLTQLLTAQLRGKERVMWVSGPFLLRIHCCPHWG